MMADVMKPVDTDAVAALVDGERCGSRRTSCGTYQNVFGEVMIARPVYQHSGRGRLRIRLDVRLGIVEGAYTKDRHVGEDTGRCLMRAPHAYIEFEMRRKELASGVQYIANQNHAGRMKYAEALRRNYLIGTGITEVPPTPSSALG